MLTPEQKKFGQEYINKRANFQGEKLLIMSAISAGIPKEFAKKIGTEWIDLPEMQEYINEEIDKTIEKTKLTRDWIVEETKKVLATSYKAVDKISCLTLLDKLLTKIDNGGEGSLAPQINIMSDGDINIL